MGHLASARALVKGGTTLTAPPHTQEFPRLKNFQDCMEPLMGTSWEEKQSFLQLPQTLVELRSRLVGMGLGFINQLLLQGQYLWPGPLDTPCHSGAGTALQGNGWGGALLAHVHLP